MSETRKPTFLILGAAKSGTTSLYHTLGQHPDVFFSTPKEPLFFEAEYERGLEHYWRKYYSGWAGETAIGEARPYNLLLPYVPQRIKESLGDDLRMIAILRDPVERAYSHWWMRYSHGQERLSFEDALEENRARVAAGVTFEGEEGPSQWRRGLRRGTGGTRYRLYLDPGYYAPQIERYLHLFPASRLKVVLYDDLAKDPESLVRELWRFVGVDPEAAFVDASPQNVARQELRHRGAWYLRRLDRHVGLGPRLPASVKRWTWSLFPSRPARRPPMQTETRARLTEHFAPHQRRLEELLHRDLSAWAGSSRPPSD